MNRKYRRAYAKKLLKQIKIAKKNGKYAKYVESLTNNTPNNEKVDTENTI
jgi:hypothetical protein